MLYFSHTHKTNKYMKIYMNIYHEHIFYANIYENAYTKTTKAGPIQDFYGELWEASP
jgi:hypothetical protein